MKQSSRWPRQLWIVRHGESAGNVARDVAHSAGLSRIDISERDVDVPLSQRGEEQSAALACWFADMPAKDRPEVLLTSPYRRAVQTGDFIARNGGLREKAIKPILDERLREKEFGVLDRLTTSGIREIHPEQSEFRRILGKFYHRPPAGESWCDVILRLRSALDTISLHHSGKSVLIVAHQVVVMCMRYLIENLTEEEILAIDRESEVANCAVTEYLFDSSIPPDGGMVLKRYNFIAPLRQGGAPVTAEPDANVAAR
ncbi:histidine phosphatase family protein [Oryzicola mucosus]|uniref:phosphoglycerate mutase (2,3-diphosphoglycerate-dependent) n=1 Tax=Oryzicola mucosus TaxID=2767425 RepID=A0A8J6U1H9_9HYPH|nr:histidine phosphatase family protein [Oryzicola mucosus]MBD0416966.1 histidine phosphatase family protein [Oryzicola mucosus]